MGIGWGRNNVFGLREREREREKERKKERKKERRYNSKVREWQHLIKQMERQSIKH